MPPPRRGSTARGEEAKALERGRHVPNARTAGTALFSLQTAIVDPNAVLASLRADLEGTGKVRLLTGRELTGVRGSRVAVTPQGEITFRRLVNAAGAHCDEVARLFGLARDLRLIPFKGIYRKLRKDRTFVVNGNIYPVPDVRNPFLGVHFTRSVHGDVYLGPTAIPALGRENYGLLAGVDGGAASILLQDAILFLRNTRFREVALTEPRKYFPGAFDRDAARLVKRYDPTDFEAAQKVGIRPQLVDWKTKELVMDFLVEASGDTVHVLNPISPAFTSSMEIARRLVESWGGIITLTSAPGQGTTVRLVLQPAPPAPPPPLEAPAGLVRGDPSHDIVARRMPPFLPVFLRGGSCGVPSYWRAVQPRCATPIFTIIEPPPSPSFSPPLDWNARHNGMLSGKRLTAPPLRAGSSTFCSISGEGWRILITPAHSVAARPPSRASTCSWRKERRVSRP